MKLNTRPMTPSARPQKAMVPVNNVEKTAGAHKKVEMVYHTDTFSSGTFPRSVPAIKGI